MILRDVQQLPGSFAFRKQFGRVRRYHRSESLCVGKEFEVGRGEALLDKISVAESVSGGFVGNKQMFLLSALT